MKKLNIKMSRFFIKDVLKFKDQAKLREKIIRSFPANDVSGDFYINRMASLMHPDFQKMVVTEIQNHPECNAKTFTLKKKDNSPCSVFRSGQYVTVNIKIGKNFVSRPYSISSSPLKTKEGIIMLTIKGVPDGFVSKWILENWKIGDDVLISGPEGQFYYEPIRDNKTIIAVAGGSGITPFLSMAQAIKDGLEDFNLIILYGSRSVNSILLKSELDNICKDTQKVTVVHVLSEEKKDGYEYGFITAELIKKYAPKNSDFSIFICGPSALYRFAKMEIAKLNKPAREVRFEAQGLSKNPSEYEEYPKDARGKTFNVTIHIGSETKTINASSSEPLLCSIEKSGLNPQNKCRSGSCSWCRSKLINGSVFIPEENDGRRYEDKKCNYIHPCASYPLSDIEIECTEGINK
ncbi:MAG: hypothetical protein HUK25_00015 [Treponema sp.]|nr:hypothetical protein [Treponema sp.]